MKNSLIFSELAIMPWAIHLGMFDVFELVLNKHLEGLALKEGKKIEADPSDYIKYSIYDGKAVIPLHGIIMNRSMGMQGLSGMVKVLDMKKTLYHALDNPAVDEIILDINSPGGTVSGTMELANMIYDARGKKHIISYANSMTASAGYWIASAAEKVYGFSTSRVGSIGVYIPHIDRSARNEKEGIKITYIQAGKYKTDGNPDEPLTDQARNELQESVDKIYNLFVSDVAKFRGMSIEDTRNAAEGKVYIGADAQKVGLIDGIINIEGLVNPSDTYSFLTEGDGMFGNKIDVKDISVQYVKENFPEVYEGIQNESAEKINAVTAERDSLAAELNLIKALNTKNEKIRKYGAKVGCASLAEELISKNCSETEAFEALLDKASENANNNVAEFEATASPAAGPANKDELEIYVKDQESAMQYCKRAYNLSNAEAWKRARKEFPNFWSKRKGDDE